MSAKKFCFCFWKSVVFAMDQTSADASKKREREEEDKDEDEEEMDEEKQKELDDASLKACFKGSMISKLVSRDQ